MAKEPGLLRKFVKYYKPHYKLLLLDIVASFIIAGIDLFYPQIFKFVLNDIVTLPKDQALRTLFIVLIVVAALYLFRALCRYIIVAWGKIMGLRMESQMREELFENYQRLSFSYYDKHNTGDLMSRVISDLSDITEAAHRGPEVILVAVIRLFGATIIIASISWKLALTLITIALIMGAILYYQNNKMKKVFMDNRRKISGINSVLQDSLGGIRVVKAFANEEIEFDKFDEANEAYKDSKTSTHKAMGRYMSLTAIYFGLTHLTIVVVGSFLVITGDLSAADLAICALYVGAFSFTIEAMINLNESFQKAGSGFRRFLEVKETIPEIKDHPHAHDLRVSAGQIEYKDIYFSYSEGEEVLHGLNLKVEPGSTLALVGQSGGGKTTICSLLMRFYEPDSGCILIDGQDISEVTQSSLRNSIGLVQQDVYLFDGTICDNISYGNPDADFDQIYQAAKKAQILDFIESLPEGFNTIVGERGTRLSGGQKQRIAIARVFLKNPKILILDEATSALDNESERYVQESLTELAKGRTTLIIAHRLSTIKNADEIVTISGGRVVERGSHEELLAKNDTYAGYYQMQFAHKE